MKISVVGSPKHLDKRLTKEAVDCYGKTLLSTQMYPYISVKVLYSKDLYKKQECWGEVAADYDADIRKHRDFRIFIDSGMSKKKSLYVLAHEMTHVAQYATGKLFEYERLPSRVKWDGKILLEEEIDYWFSPWEIEARGYEEALYHTFINRKKD